MVLFSKKNEIESLRTPYLLDTDRIKLCSGSVNIDIKLNWNLYLDKTVNKAYAMSSAARLLVKTGA